MDWFLRGEAFFYWGMLVQRQSYCGDYACPHGGVTVSVSDGTDSSTQVTAARGVWGACGLVLSCQAFNAITFCGPGPTNLSRC
jgi:hypothetical protein